MENERTFCSYVIQSWEGYLAIVCGWTFLYVESYKNKLRMWIFTSINDKLCFLTFLSVINWLRINTDALTNLKWQRSLLSLCLIFLMSRKIKYVKL